MNDNQNTFFSFGGRLAGEFVIIVLGVLAALGVDNWRESRTEAELQNSYLERLADDLYRDFDAIRSAT